MTYIPNPAIKFADSPILDAFGRQRVSQPSTVLDSKQLFDSVPLIFDTKLTGGGTATHQPTRAATELAVTTTGDRVIRQTFQKFIYQPGRSLLMHATGVLSKTSIATGASSKIGLFDGYNGVFFELENTIMKVVTRNNQVDTKVAQSAWNLDKLDGTGPSGITLDPTKAQLFSIDLQWLGVGRVRMGLDVNGILIHVHEFRNANEQEEVYMRTPNLPVRYELESTGGARSMDHICIAVSVEGLVGTAGQIRSIDRGAAPTASFGVGVVVPVISFRLKSTHLGSLALPKVVTILSPSGADIRFTLLHNPIIGGSDAASWIPLANSAIEYDISRTITNGLTGGTQVASGYVLGSAQQSGTVATSLDIQLRLGASIDEVPDELILGAELLSGTGTVIGGITIRELL
jgi:hypothetical protein